MHWIMSVQGALQRGKNHRATTETLDFLATYSDLFLRSEIGRNISDLYRKYRSDTMDCKWYTNIQPTFTCAYESEVSAQTTRIDSSPQRKRVSAHN